MRRNINGYLFQCIIKKFGTQKAFAEHLTLKFGKKVQPSTVSHAISYRFNVTPEDLIVLKQNWADTLGEPVDKLFK